jgi:hypothetical protein
MQILDGKVYILSYMNVLSVFNIADDGSLEHLTNFSPPAEMMINYDLNMRDFYIKDTLAVIVTDSNKQVIGFDLTTRDVVFSGGFFSIESASYSPIRLNGIKTPQSCVILPNGKIYFTDIGNHNIKEFYIATKQLIAFNIPQNIEILQSCSEFEKDENGEYLFRVDIDKVEPIKIVYRNMIAEVAEEVVEEE